MTAEKDKKPKSSKGGWKMTGDLSVKSAKVTGGAGQTRVDLNITKMTGTKKLVFKKNVSSAETKRN